jgi:hypothetical protein
MRRSRPDLVVVMFLTQVQLVHQSQFTQQTQGAVYRGETETRAALAREAVQLVGIQMTRLVFDEFQE